MPASTDEQQQMLTNRIRKNRRRLKSWRKRERVSCYRVYDKDIPELPFAIDLYEDAVHVAEYVRPHERSEEEHDEWVDAMVEAAAEALEVSPEHAFVKRRQRQRGSSQYDRVGRAGASRVVSEGGLQFLVNLSDYLDTGLFLDHRPLRQHVRGTCRKLRVLNLFCYTGAFSVHAAAGGAAEVMSIDLSNTYLEWAQENLELNGLRAAKHEFIRADVLEALPELFESGRRYDLVICDPPTFSNSKKMEDVFDVGRDQAKLLEGVLSVCNPGATIWFSTNFRKFRPDDELFERLGAEETSDWTVPPDFRNRRIHRSWKMTRGSE